MMMKTRTLGILGSALALSSVLSLSSGRVAAQQHDDMNIDKMIETAKTAADHEAIANYYAQQSTAAKEHAAEHRKMGADYKKAGGAAIGKWHLDHHCEALASSADAEAKQYAALAAAHRAMAKSAK